MYKGVFKLKNKIRNVDIWGLDESVHASGYPMSHGVPPLHWGSVPTDKRYAQASRLAKAPTGSGHDCWLKGVIVQFDWTISQTIYPQVERYHFIDIISSQSKMHRLYLAEKKDFNEHVDSVILNRFLEMVEEYNNEDNPLVAKDLFLKLVYSVPMGYELTARFSTNYLQLKTIYQQRKNHKLNEWQEFCKWVETLPKFKEWVLG